MFCRPLNAKKMGIHLFGKGCLDTRLVSQCKAILDALPLHTLDAFPDPNPIVMKLQKQMQYSMLDELSFWSSALQYLEAVGKLASVLPNTLVVDVKSRHVIDTATATLSAVQLQLQAVMSTRKRFSSFWCVVLCLALCGVAHSFIFRFGSVRAGRPTK